MEKDLRLRRLKDKIRTLLEEAATAYSDCDFRRQVEQMVEAECSDEYWTAGEKARIVKEVFDAFRGLDALQPLIDDPDITEIMVNGHRDIFVERCGKIVRADCKLESRERLEDLIQTLVGRVNRTVNESSPIVDARLIDGSRIHVVLPPVSLNGPILTIRKFPKHPLTMERLVRIGSLPEEIAVFLENAVKRRTNIFVSGATASGKTTFLNALSEFIPRDERVITIEDSAELQLRYVPNVVSLEVRNANPDGKGAITIRDLIRASLRMRPDRIIVGEVRGAEAADMLQALNTGHDGSMSTGHANSAEDLLNRLEAMVMSGMPMPVEAIRSQICSAIELVVHLRRMRDGSRKVAEIVELQGMSGGKIVVRPIYRLKADMHERRPIGA